MKAKKRGTPILLARLPGAFSPMLAMQEVDEFTLEKPFNKYIILTEGSNVASTQMIMHPYIANIQYGFDMFAHTCTFTAGQTSIRVNSDAFEQYVNPETGETEGIYNFDIEVPTGEISYCFNTENWQQSHHGLDPLDPEPSNGDVVTLTVTAKPVGFVGVGFAVTFEIKSTATRSKDNKDQSTIDTVRTDFTVEGCTQIINLKDKNSFGKGFTATVNNADKVGVLKGSAVAHKQGSSSAAANASAAVNVVKLDRVQISRSVDTAIHNAEVIYTASAYDAQNNDITKYVSFDWRSVQSKPGGVDEHALFGGSTKKVTWTLGAPEGSISAPNPKYAGSNYVEGAVLFLKGTGCGGTAETNLQLTISKGVGTDEEVDGPISQSSWVAGPKGKQIATQLSLPGIATEGSLSYSAKVSISGKVTSLIDKAKAGVKVGQFGIELELGGTKEEISTSIDVSGSEKYPLSKIMAVRATIYGGTQTSYVAWKHYTRTTYSSGFVDYVQRGYGTAAMTSPLITLEALEEKYPP